MSAEPGSGGSPAWRHCPVPSPVLVGFGPLAVKRKQAAVGFGYGLSTLQSLLAEEAHKPFLSVLVLFCIPDGLHAQGQRAGQTRRVGAGVITGDVAFDKVSTRFLVRYM